jgi:hypothetical protein
LSNLGNAQLLIDARYADGGDADAIDTSLGAWRSIRSTETESFRTSASPRIRAPTLR